MSNSFILKCTRFCFVSLAIIGILIIIKYTFLYTYPFIIAFIIAYLLHPVVTKMEISWRINRAIATLFIMMFLFICMLTLSGTVIKRLFKEANFLVEFIPQQVHHLNELITDIGQTLLLPYYEIAQKTIPFLPSYEELEFERYLQFILDELGASSSFFFKNVVLTTSTILSSLSYGITILIFISLAAFFMTKDFGQLKLVLSKMIPKRFLMKLEEVTSYLKSSVFGFVRAQIIITIISSIIVLIGLFAIQVENVLTLTLIVFFVDFVPYLGIGAIFLPWIIYNFFIGEFSLNIQLSLLYITIIIVRQFIEPRILASNIGIHPLVALIILFVGIQSLGLIGIFITPILLIMLSAIYHAQILHFLWTFIKDG